MSATESSPTPSEAYHEQPKKAAQKKKMNDIVEPEHPAPSEHAVPPPIPQNSINVDQLLEDHKLLNRLSQYPLVKAVCEQTSEIYTKAKQMSPQVVSNGLDKAHATIADVINKPAPVNLAPVEDFGCRQLDMLDNALETSIGKSLTNLTSKVAHAGVVLVNKTPLHSLTSSADPSTSIQHGNSKGENSQNPSITQKIYSEIQEKGLMPTLQTNFVSGSDRILARVEDFFALEHAPHLRPENQLHSNVPNKRKRNNQHEIHLPEEADSLLVDRTVNLTANGVYQVAKRVDNFVGNKLSDQTKKSLGKTITTTQSIISALFQMIFIIFLSLPYIRNHQDYITSKTDIAREQWTDLQEVFLVALDQAEKRDSTMKSDAKLRTTNFSNNKNDQAKKKKNQTGDSKDEELEKAEEDLDQPEKPKNKKKGSGIQKGKK